MLLKDVLKGIDIKGTNCDLNKEISAVSHDSRHVGDGTLFVAISGFQTDGNKYAKGAVESGAAAVLTEKADESLPYVLVENARRALAVAAANFHSNPTKKMTMIGVTGTNGKTTVTYLLKRVLEGCGKKVGLIGTNQNMIGDEVIATERTTPDGNALQALFARMEKAGCDCVVMEVSSHSLVLDRVYGIEFEVGVYTNLSRDHLDFHGDMENYAKAKAMLFDRCKYGVINVDDEYSSYMLNGKNCEYITCTIKDNDADLVCEGLKLSEEGVSFTVNNACFTLNVPGEFSVYNALSVIGASRALGIPMETCAEYLAKATGVSGRAEIVPVEADYTVMIDYAHSPDGLENILSTVKGFVQNRIIVVFGCGGNRDATKRPIMGEIASRLADVVVVTSDNPRCEEPMEIINQILPGIDKNAAEVYVEESRYDAIHYALSIAQKGDLVLLAGKGHETYQEINGVKHHMDEREIIAEYFKK